MAAEHQLAQGRMPGTVTLEDIEEIPNPDDAECDAVENDALVRARTLIRQLPTLTARLRQSRPDLTKFTSRASYRALALASASP